MGSFLGERRAPATRLRELLAAGRPLVAPGAYDALSARLIEIAGFDAVYMTGFGSSASLLGRPDVGLLTQTEMVDNARRLAAAVDVPLISDADTGYGNPINVVRTVHEFEQAGVAAIHLEDQVSPKRCGHMTGKQVVPADDMVAKLRAAAAARTDPDFVLIARTDARAVEGLDAALERGRRYVDAGADVLFVEAPESEAEIERVAETFRGTPLLFNWAEGGRTPPVGLDRLAELGFAVVIFPVGALLAAATGVVDLLRTIRDEGTPASALAGLTSFTDFFDLVGLDEIRDLEQRFTS